MDKDRKLKISIFAPEPYLGGEVNYLKSLLQALIINKYDVWFYVTESYLNYFAKYINQVEYILCSPFLNRYIKTNRFDYYIRFFLQNLFTIKKMYLNSDIVVLGYPDFQMTEVDTNVPIILIVYDVRAKYMGEKDNLIKKFKRYIKDRIFQDKILNRAKYIVVETNKVKEDLERFYSVPPSKIKVIVSPPPINRVLLEKINNPYFLKKVIAKYSLSQKYIFYPGHIIAAKNHISLLKAILLLREKYNMRVNTVLCGSSPDKNYLNKLVSFIEKHNLKDSISYLGYINNYEDVLAILKSSTALVMPTLFESLSLPIWEAFYLRVPVVSSNVCALPEQIGDAGLLFDPNNVEDIAENIYKIVTDNNLRKKIVMRGLKRIEEISLEKYARQWREIIENI